MVSVGSWKQLCPTYNASAPSEQSVEQHRRRHIKRRIGHWFRVQPSDTSILYSIYQNIPDGPPLEFIRLQFPALYPALFGLYSCLSLLHHCSIWRTCRLPFVLYMVVSSSSGLLSPSTLVPPVSLVVTDQQIINSCVCVISNLPRRLFEYHGVSRAQFTAA